MKRVVVHIDRLVLRGFRHEDMHALAAGLQETLMQTLAERGSVASLAAGGNVERMKAAEVHVVGQSTGARLIGARVANAIGKGLLR